MTEIFIEPELENLELIENAAEWQSICSELGLSGQTSLSENSPESKAPPYMTIDDKTQRIIKTLCPVQYKVEDYNGGAIPLDILKEIKKAKDNGWFKKIFILADDKTPDPFVVGQLHGEHDWNAKYMLIGRWGAELLPFEVLEQKAIERLRVSAKECLMTMKSYVDNGIADLDHFVQKHLCGHSTPSFNFSIGDMYRSNHLPF